LRSEASLSNETMRSRCAPDGARDCLLPCCPELPAGCARRCALIRRDCLIIGAMRGYMKAHMTARPKTNWRRPLMARIFNLGRKSAVLRAKVMDIRSFRASTKSQRPFSARQHPYLRHPYFMGAPLGPRAKCGAGVACRAITNTRGQERGSSGRPRPKVESEKQIPRSHSKARCCAHAVSARS
jgi:hypothetical protein